MLTTSLAKEKKYLKLFLMSDMAKQKSVFSLLFGTILFFVTRVILLIHSLSTAYSVLNLFLVSAEIKKIAQANFVKIHVDCIKAISSSNFDFSW